MNLRKLQEILEDRGTWLAIQFTGSQRARQDLVTEQQFHPRNLSRVFKL